MTTQQRRRSAFPVLASLLLSAAAWSPSCAYDFEFSSPKAGETYHVGDVMHIEFYLTPTSMGISSDMIGFSNKAVGDTFAYLPLALNGTDTVSQKMHYDWIIPDSITSSRKSSRIYGTVSDSCRINIAPYGNQYLTVGVSGVFSIKASSSIHLPRESFFVRRADMTNARLWIDLTRAGITGPSISFSIDGRLQSIVNPRHGIGPGVRKEAGISTIP